MAPQAKCGWRRMSGRCGRPSSTATPPTRSPNSCSRSALAIERGELVALILFEAGGRLEEPDIATIEQQVIADPPELRLRLALRVPSTPTTRRCGARSP